MYAFDGFICVSNQLIAWPWTFFYNLFNLLKFNANLIGKFVLQPNIFGKSGRAIAGLSYGPFRAVRRKFHSKLPT
jgi:hypothetical protein